jgi:CspA family cold shock protein
MATGTVKFFNDQKGFGFIVDDVTKQEIFVHITGIEKAGEELTEQERIAENDAVSYTTEETQKGTNAINVKKI